MVARSGPFARTILRSERPRYFWAVITVYTGLALGLIFIFRADACLRDNLASR